MVPVVPVKYWVQPSGAFHSAVQGICMMWIFQLLVVVDVQVNSSSLQVGHACRYIWYPVLVPQIGLVELDPKDTAVNRASVHCVLGVNVSVAALVFGESIEKVSKFSFI